MKRTLPAAILFWASIVSLSALPKVAVLDIIPQAGIDTSVIVPITESIMEEVVGVRAYIVLDRAYIEKVLTEQAFQLSSMVSDTQAAQAGQYLGADYVITGKVQTLGDSYFLVAKMIEVRTGVIVSQSTEQGAGKINVLLGMAHSLARKLVGGAPISPLAPVATVETPQAGPAKVKVGFLIPTGLDDTINALIPGLRAIEDRYVRNGGWLDMVVAERVNPDTFDSEVKKLVEAERCRIVISAEWGFAQRMAEAARRWPEVFFWSAGGEYVEDRDPNLGVYGFNEFPQHYLMGLVAGSMTRSGRIGFLSDSPSDRNRWVFHHADIFALGVKAANPRATVYIRFLPEGHWDRRGPQREAAEALIRERCDFIAGVSGDEVMRACQASAQAGKPVRMFQTDLSYRCFPDVIVSGPMRDWALLWERPLLALKDGNWKKEAFFPPASIRFGGLEAPFNPAFAPELAAKKIRTPDSGEVPLLDLLERRARQIEADQFNPFTGPIKDQKGRVRIPAGVSADWPTIDAIDYLVDNIKGTIPGW